MVDRRLVERRAQQLAHYLEALRGFKALSLKAFIEDATKRYAAERLMQLIVDEAIDINAHLILSSRHAPPKDYYSSFVQLASLGVCPRALALALAPTTALRSALVHGYEEVNVNEVHRHIGRFLALYPRYLRGVLEFVRRSSRDQDT
jgi:uncharacterized protein YutE (UPF0331/DUF86 family)